ncbi:MAG: hypothetical protein JNL35_09345 [Sphingopyxis sp.]|nr:hypothetical protein [Sphingopyxis sp.]
MGYFAITCTTDLGNTQEARRLVLMRKFLDDGLGTDIRVIDHMMFPDYAKAGLVVLVEAATADQVQQAIGFCDGIFHTSVDEVRLRAGPRSDACPARFGIFGVKLPDQASPQSLVAASGDSGVQLWIEFMGGSLFESLMIVDQPTFALAKQAAEALLPGAALEAQCGTSLAGYLQAKRDSQPLAAAPLVADPADSGSQTIYCTDSDVVLASPQLSATTIMPFTPAMQVQRVKANSQTTVSGPAIIWSHASFSTFQYYLTYRLIYPHVTVPFANQVPVQGTSNWGLPTGIVPWAGDGAVFRIENDRNGGFSTVTVSAMTTWLNNVMMTATYDAPWPEDSYQGTLAAAYAYIVSQMPGQVPPKNGTILQTGTIDAVTYPAGAAFPESDFNTVKSHLLDEVAAFATAEHWFGINGIINAVNSGIAILSTDDLITAANNMQIPPSGTSMEATLNDIFSCLFAVISCIPYVGSAIAAVGQIGWTLAKAAMAPGAASTPIQAVIADLAQQLNSYLIQMNSAADTQHQTLAANWGRLQAFYNGVIEGTIAEAMFYASSSAADDDGSHPGSQYYQQMASNGWLVYFYKQLFQVAHTVQGTISLQGSLPNNPWNPAAGQYHFTWAVPAGYVDGKGNNATGFMVVDCSTDAPAQAMAELFGPDSQLNVNPIAFFAGFDGWHVAVPKYDAGSFQASEPNNKTWLPLYWLGEPQWAGSFG